MTQPVMAILVFCEGSHDVAFVRRVLEGCLGFMRVEWRFSEFPAPFNSLFKTSVERHAARDLSLDMAHKFFLPDRVLVRENLVALLFQSGGKDQKKKVAELLAELLPLLIRADVFPEGATSIVTQIRYLFLYDADHEGAERIRQTVRDTFGTIGDSPWLTGEWQVDPARPAGAIAGDQALFVWGSDHQQGTLEDTLMPIFWGSDKDLANAAQGAIETLFPWDTKAESLKKAVTESAKRNKAIITLAGQREKPGSSLNVIVDQTNVLKKEVFVANEYVSAFANFIASFIGLEDSLENEENSRS